MEFNGTVVPVTDHDTSIYPVSPAGALLSTQSQQSASAPTAQGWKTFNDCVEISFESSLSETNEKDGAQHAVHCLIWSVIEKPHYGLDKDKSVPSHSKAAILMHLRHDGHIGFPGGLVDDSLDGLDLETAKQTVVEALSRELLEELNIDPKKHKINFNEHYLYSHRSTRDITGRTVFTHFFTFQVSPDTLYEIEVGSLSSHEHGREVLGNFRIPLYTMLDGYRGFPAFLNNNFIGNSRQQLLDALTSLKILSKEEIDKALASSNLFKSK